MRKEDSAFLKKRSKRLFSRWPRSLSRSQGDKSLFASFSSEKADSYAPAQWREAALAALAMLTGQANAATRAPLLTPLHDVTIEYSLTPPNHVPLELVVQAQAGGQKLRVRGENLPVELVIDRSAQIAHILLPIAGAYANVPIGDQDPQRGVLLHARFTRHGARKVAGVGCVDWSAVWGGGNASACISGEGVILEGNLNSEHHGTTRLIAHRVTEGPISREMFVVPANYTNTGAFPIPAFDPGQ